MKKRIWIIIAIVIVIGAAAPFIVKAVHDRTIKGGPGSPNLFSANSDKTIVEYEGKSVEVTGEQRNQLIQILLTVYMLSEELSVEKDSIDYNIYIDFCNGRSGSISVAERIFFVQEKYCPMEAGKIEELNTLLGTLFP